MAVLSIQLAITLVVASVMSRVGPFFSFARWLLTRGAGLVRYVHPDDDELRHLANLPPKKYVNPEANGSSSSKGGRRSRNLNHQQQHQVNGTGDVFNVPKSIDLQLDTADISVHDIVQLRFYTEYQWLLDFCLYGLLVYALTECYATAFPARAATEINLGLVWSVLVAGFAYKILASLSGLYFDGGDESAGERSMVIVMFFVYLFVAMMVLVVDEDTLETGLDDAYETFNRTAAAFLADNAGLDSSGPASKLVLKFFLALWCGSIGALLTFPGLRLARMQWDALKHSESSGVATVLLHAAFVAPLLLTTLWVKPLSRDYLTERVYAGMEQPIMTPDQFESARLYAVLAVVAFRLAVMPRYLQSYLNIAYYRVAELKQEAGKISNVDLQRLVARIFYYLCVVTLQYVAPMILVLYLALMYKTMGGGTWTGMALIFSPEMTDGHSI